MTDAVTRRAPAKINLTLDVGPLGSDGFHPVRTIMQTLELHDTVTVTRMPKIPGISLSVSGLASDGVPADPSNLVWQAAVRLQKIAAARKVAPAGELGIHIGLAKNVPLQAGLGGGSSDAAATLLALNMLWALNLSMSKLQEVAASLGSDVTFFLHGGTALCEGRGEKVTPLVTLSPAWPLVIVRPSVGVSTATAYAALDTLPTRVPGTATEHWLAPSLFKRTANDFEAVIYGLYPKIGAVRDALEDFGAGPRLCGSGSALFCRASSGIHAFQIAEYATTQRLGAVWITNTENALDTD